MPQVSLSALQLSTAGFFIRKVEFRAPRQHRALTIPVAWLLCVCVELILGLCYVQSSKMRLVPSSTQYPQHDMEKAERCLVCAYTCLYVQLSVCVCVHVYMGVCGLECWFLGAIHLVFLFVCFFEAGFLDGLELTR